MTPIEFVHTCQPFDQPDKAELELVEQTLEIFNFLPGTFIIKQDGAPSAHLYLIREGIVRLLRKGEEIGRLTRGETFGYPSMLLKDAPRLDIMSGGHVIIYGVPEETFHQLVNNHAFAAFILKDLSQRLVETWEMQPALPGSDLARPQETVAHRFQTDTLG